MRTDSSDDLLLTSDDPEAFGIFYARHRAGVQAFFARRVGHDRAADLTAETFAAALVARRRFVPSDTPAAGWLYVIAGRRLIDCRRRDAVEMRTREALTAETALIRATAVTPSAENDLAAGLLRHLPPDQRDALRARFQEDRAYDEIAAHAGTSAASVRQRVSRGLSALRGPLRIYRAAQELAGEDRGYRLGGGHGERLEAIAPRAALDCSAAASLLLLRAGVFIPDRAWSSARFASDWGNPGEGRYVTLWAGDGHVWLEFKLDADHGERFDPTPTRCAPHSRWITRSPAPKANLNPRHWPGL